jgi:UDP-N-acetylmuramoyl-tripeptide--D-alanyl-D-alanine ligase
VKALSLSVVSQACEGTLNAAAEDLGADSLVQGFGVDSRTIRPGEVFVAIKGDRVDGHDFAADVLAAGAAAVLSSRDIPDVPCIVVTDPVLALGKAAAWYRREILSARVIGITGSSGKTTTKDLVADTLDGIVVAAQGSFNTEVGVPLTILSADEDTEYLVLEMGMRGLGHIQYLAEMASPDIGVVLNVGTAHLGMMNSREDIAQAKGELVTALTPHAWAVLNVDDSLVAAMGQQTDAKTCWFGRSPDADVRAEKVNLDSSGHPTFVLLCGQEEPVDVRLAFHGEHFVDAALASAAVGHLCGMKAARIAHKLNNAHPRNRWRMEVQRTPEGVTVISDVYNANPESMRAALKTLRAMAGTGKTWAVLGEMKELGESSVHEHDAIGRLAVRLDISRLVCVGSGTKAMHLAATNEGSWGEESLWVEDPVAALEVLRNELTSGDVVLIKASRAVGLESIAESLLAGSEGAA